MYAVLYSPGEETSKTRDQENTAIRLPQDAHISSVSVTVLNCNYVLVHAVIEQGIGESGGWTLRLGEVWKDHRVEVLCRDTVMFPNILVVAGRSWRQSTNWTH